MSNQHLGLRGHHDWPVKSGSGPRRQPAAPPSLKGSPQSRHYGCEAMKRFVLPILLAAALPAADSRIMPAMNAFTAASYKQLTGGEGNLILSPFNIATALSMALAGARGQTAEEI